MDLFYSNFDNDDKLITINQIDSKHIIRSFRKKIGDIIKITNGWTITKHLKLKVTKAFKETLRILLSKILLKKR